MPWLPGPSPAARRWLLLRLLLGASRSAASGVGGQAAEVDADVIVIGVGPVGNYLSQLLSAFSVPRILAFEKNEDTYFAPRAVIWDDYTLRSADMLGQEVATWMRWHTRAMMGRENLTGCQLGLRSGQPENRWNAGCYVVGEAAALGKQSMDTSPHFGHSFHQPTWERHLRRALGKLPNVTVRFGHEVLDVEPLDGFCRVHVRGSHPGKAEGGGQEVLTYTARYCVAADGGASASRKSLGIEYEGKSFPDQPWIVLDTEVRDEAYLRESWLGREGTGFVMNPKCPFVYVVTPAFFEEWWAEASDAAANASTEEERHALREAALQKKAAKFSASGKPWPPTPSHHRFEVMLEKDVSKEEAVSGAFVEKLLRECAQVDPDRMLIQRKVVYTFHSRRALQWRKGSVLLAGDAAHCMPPFLGAGMNSGLRDAANIAWKLAMILQGRAADSLLDTYHPERLLNLDYVTSESIKIGQRVMVRDPLRAYVRDLILMVMKGAYGKIVNQPIHIRSDVAALANVDSNKLSGTLFPSPEVIVKGRGQMMLDGLLNLHGFTLVLVARGGSAGGAGDAPQRHEEDSGEEEAAYWFQQRTGLGAQIVEVSPFGTRQDDPAADGLGKQRQPLLSIQKFVHSRCSDAEGVWTEWVAQHALQEKLIVVRPDRFIFGIFDDVKQANAALTEILWGKHGPSSSSAGAAVTAEL